VIAAAHSAHCCLQVKTGDLEANVRELALTEGGDVYNKSRKGHTFQSTAASACHGMLHCIVE